VAVALDLDGTVWLAGQPLPGAPDAVRRLRDTGHAVAFVTNNSSARRVEVAAALDRAGIAATADEVVTSGVATASLVRAGETVLVCGGPGLTEELEAVGARTVRDGDADVVAVGYHRDFDYERMRIAARAVRRGARLVGSNADATYPTPDGPLPGAGAILASVVTAAGVPAQVAGKPHEPMARVVRSRLGPHGWVVGDRLDTDGRFAVALGYRFALVLSGVTAAGDRDPAAPVDVVGDDLASVVGDLLRAGPG
jgi:HAD superfamily hydrolase (TIGR01450 family)